MNLSHQRHLGNERNGSDSGHVLEDIKVYFEIIEKVVITLHLGALHTWIFLQTSFKADFLHQKFMHEPLLCGGNITKHTQPQTNSYHIQRATKLTDNNTIEEPQLPYHIPVQFLRCPVHISLLWLCDV